MSTGSLRARVIISTLLVLTGVLVVVVAAVTLTYRSQLTGDLHNRLKAAGAAVERGGSAGQAKQLLPGLALEGIAADFSGARTTTKIGGTPAKVPVKTGDTIQSRGSLLVLDEVLSDGTHVTLSASRASIDNAVTRLLLIELAVAATALALATLLAIWVTRTALRPLSTVIDTATRISQGDSRLRLRPTRTDTELGRLAVAFDQMLDALETAVDEARASDAATRRFLADASHELRNPIAALQASVETLLREQPDRPERDRLEAAVARDGERLGRLVDDLLGLARLEAHPTRAPTDLASIAQPLVESAQARAPRATITLRAETTKTVSGDPDGLERVLRNLIDNAVAAIQPTGRIDVRVQRVNGYVQALVTDDGPGVPDDQRQRIFERFVRLDPGKPGHGLGLAIARRIARQHHGDLTCDPAQRGASFTLSLPAEP